MYANNNYNSEIDNLLQPTQEDMKLKYLNIPKKLNW